MTAFRLKKGTIVKHGTLASRFGAILKSGLKPGPRQEGRATIEPNPVVADQVYVGVFSAYFGAYAAFAEYARSVLPYPDRPPLQTFEPDRPIVFRVELQDDVPVLADEDFASIMLNLDSSEPTRDQLLETAEECWSRFGSVTMPPIPPTWITAVEVMDFEAIFCDDALRKERLKCDLHTLCCGVVQVQQRLDLSQCSALWKQAIASDEPSPTFANAFDPRRSNAPNLNKLPLAHRDRRAESLRAVGTVFAELSAMSPEYGIAADRS